MTDDILNKMDERKAVKERNEEHYQHLNKGISTDCWVAKENWLNEQCREVEDLERQFRTKEMHQKFKQMTNKSKANTNMGCTKDRNGNILFDKEKISGRLVEYIKELYDDNREPMPQFTTATGQNILKEEVENVTHLVKMEKLMVQMIYQQKHLSHYEHNIDIITTLCNIIYNTGYIPTEMKQSVFVPIPKKPKAQNCNEYRAISLMSHVTKLLLKIIQVGITAKINKKVSELQSGFRSGMGMREGIFNLRSICERALEVAKEVCLCFIDYTKAFD